MRRVMIFDAGGTLFWNDAFNAHVRTLGELALSSRLTISRELAAEVISTTRATLSRTLGFKPSLTAVLVRSGVPLPDWHGFLAARAETSKFFDVDENLRRLFERYARKERKVVASNMPVALSGEILSTLGVRHEFVELFAPNSEDEIKPSDTLLERIILSQRIDPTQSVFIGDREDIDLSPASRHGMSVVKVSSRRELTEFMERFP